MAKTPTKSSMTKEIGVSVDRNPSNQIRPDEFLSQLRGQRGIRRFREMRENDATVGAIMFTIEQMLRPVKWEFKPSSDSREAIVAADIVNRSMNQLEIPFTEFISDALSFFTYGFSTFEKVFHRDPATGHIMLSRLSPRPQWSIERMKTKPSGDLVSVEQSSYFKRVSIPAEKVVHFRTTPENQNPSGRALDPETLIPTPNGWRCMDDFQEGDSLFGSDGRITYVSARQDWDDRPCYEIEFSNGQTVIADANHLWKVQDKNGRPKGAYQLKTTEQMFNAGNRKSSTVSTIKWSIPWAGALDYPKQHLPLDPYYLGYWLGDGHSANSRVATHIDDVEELVAEFESAGYACKVTHNGPAGGKGRTISVSSENGKWHTSNPSNILGMLGVKNNKHIPEAYLRGDIDQRVSLLQGLMDSDGYINSGKSCEFTNTNAGLAYGVAELVRSLGYSCRVTTGVTDHGTPQWVVHFTVDMQPFRLKRKVARCATVRARKNHYIKSIRKVPNRRTVCIEVTARDHMFLCSESMIQTHNSALRNAYVSYYRLSHLQEIEAIAIERELNGLPVGRIPSSFLGANATSDQKNVRFEMEKILREIKKNEQGFMLLPSELQTDEEGKLSTKYLVDVQLLSSNGTRDIDVSKAIIRYQQDIARSVMADFVMLGANDRGSFAMSSSKSALFLKALHGYMDNIRGTLKTQLMPQWMEMNGLPISAAPDISYGVIQSINIDELGTYVQKLAMAGAPLFPDDTLEDHLRSEANLPSSSGEGMPIIDDDDTTPPDEEQQ